MAAVTASTTRLELIAPIQCFKDLQCCRLDFVCDLLIELLPAYQRSFKTCRYASCWISWAVVIFEITTLHNEISVWWL